MKKLKRMSFVSIALSAFLLSCLVPSAGSAADMFKGGKKIGGPGLLDKKFPKKFPWAKHEDDESSASEDCSQTPDDGWLTVTEVRSEDDFQIGYDDAVMGRQFSKFDNDSSIVCVADDLKNVYVGETASDSNLGAFIDSDMDCKVRNDDLSSGGRGVDKLICP